jgi:hypothetical protein
MDILLVAAKKDIVNDYESVINQAAAIRWVWMLMLSPCKTPRDELRRRAGPGRGDGQYRRQPGEYQRGPG